MSGIPGYATAGISACHSAPARCDERRAIMKIGVNLGPCGDWPAMLDATRHAERLGFDAIGFLDHYHSEKLEWPYICGWSAYGALAMATSRIHLVPLVIDRLNYLPGVLAKETAA